MQIDPSSRDRANYLEVIGRLRPGVRLRQARAILAGVDEQFRAAFPDIVVDRGAEAIDIWPLRECLYGEARPALLVLMAAVLAVLLIACVNLANLQLVRAAERRREIAIRCVLGAGVWPLVRPLLVESMLLAVIGGAGGTLAGLAGLPLLLSLSPTPVEALAPIRIDGSVLLFTTALTILAGLLFGLAPALGAARSAPHTSIQESGGARATGGRRGMRIRRLLMVAEVSLSLVLLTAAALLVKSFSGILATAPGFAPDHVLTARVALPQQRYGNPAALDRFDRRVLERLAAIPGVTHAAIAVTLPFGQGPRMPFIIDGRYRGKGISEGTGRAEYRAVTADFFAALRIPVVRGRGFNDFDGPGTPGVALANETAARRFWPKGDALGARVTVGPPSMPELADPAPRTIVGLVADVRENGLDQELPPILYVPVSQISPPFASMLVTFLPINVLIRTEGASAGLASAHERSVWAVDPEQPVTEVRWMDDLLSRSLDGRRFGALVLGLLTLIALLLAAIGIYGILSYVVEQRTREIGVRMALGASGAMVLRMVVGEGMGAVFRGLTFGLAGAFVLTRLLANQLVGVGIHDPAAFALAPAILLVVAFLACSLPAYRVSRLHPLVALGRD